MSWVIAYALAKKKIVGWNEIKDKLASEGAKNIQYDPNLDGNIELSKVTVDVDKDWNGKNITNLGSGGFNVNSKLGEIDNKLNIADFKLSGLEIDADKDWNGKRILNIHSMRFQNLTANPSLVQGLVWFRGDVNSLYITDGSSAFTLLREDKPVLIKLEKIAEGSISADGTEQELFSSSSPRVYHGFLDVSGMQAGDTVVLKYYVVVQSGGGWKLLDKLTLTGAQDSPAVPLARIFSYYGVRITLQQTAGTYRTFYYLILAEAS